MIRASRNTRKGLVAGFLLLQIVFGYVGQTINVAHAQLNTNAPAPSNAPVYQGVEQSIAEYLCVPSDSNVGTALFDCITKVYKFGVAFGALALVFFIVIAGYTYMSGGEAAKQKAKSIFVGALTGMAIILFSFLLLSFINPDLVKIKPIQPPIFTASNLPSCEQVGLGVNCVLPSGQVNIASNGGGTAVGSGKCESRTGAGGLSCKAGCARKDGAKCVNTYDAIINRASQQYGVEVSLIKAIIQQESTWNPGAASHVGAQGLMQLMSGAIKDAGCVGNINDPEVNIMCGTKYWTIAKRYVNDRAPGAGNSIRHVAAAYNGGAGNGHFSKNKCGDLYNYECPFTNSSKTACTLPQPNEMANYAVSVEEYNNQYKTSCR